MNRLPRLLRLTTTEEAAVQSICVGIRKMKRNGGKMINEVVETWENGRKW